MTIQRESIPTEGRDHARERAAETKADRTEPKGERAEPRAERTEPRAERTEPNLGGASYWPEQKGSRVEERWEHIQVQFVDDPRRSVSEAHQLVSQLVQLIVDRLGQERDGLERQWSRGDDVSTEDLRICLQRYRDFFSRLQPSVGDVSGATSDRRQGGARPDGA